MTTQTIRIRKLGAVTFGMVLVVSGILFLSRLLFPALDYSLIFRLWPVILIALGIEVLAGSRWKNYEVRDQEGNLLEQNRVVYDVPAILLTAFLTGFSMIMGILDWAFFHMQTLHFS